MAEPRKRGNDPLALSTLLVRNVPEWLQRALDIEAADLGMAKQAVVLTTLQNHFYPMRDEDNPVVAFEEIRGIVTPHLKECCECECRPPFGTYYLRIHKSGRISGVVCGSCAHAHVEQEMGRG